MVKQHNKCIRYTNAHTLTIVDQVIEQQPPSPCKTTAIHKDIATREDSNQVSKAV